MSRTWGIVPAAGLGTRIQPIGFSKELLPVGTRRDKGIERPRAVCEYLLDRMLHAGANRICFVTSPLKSDLIHYFGGNVQGTAICYAIQPVAEGLCDALFTALPFISAPDDVLVGLPDTVWFPENGFDYLPRGWFSFLTFRVDRPEFFDAVAADDSGYIREIEVKSNHPSTEWVWGAFRLSGEEFSCLHGLWQERGRQDRYLGTLVNAYIARGAKVRAVPRGEMYVDVGTLDGYRQAVRVLSEHSRADGQRVLAA
jgi:glucose-1-phosphate thymidylyltransferase